MINILTAGGLAIRSYNLLNEIKVKPTTKNINKFIKNITQVKNSFGNLFGKIKIRNDFDNHSKTYSDLLHLKYLNPEVGFKNKHQKLITRALTQSLNQVIESPNYLSISQPVIMKHGNADIDDAFTKLYHGKGFNQQLTDEARQDYMDRHHFAITQEKGSLTVEPKINFFDNVDTLNSPFNMTNKIFAELAIEHAREKNFTVDETITEIKHAVGENEYQVQFIGCNKVPYNKGSLSSYRGITESHLDAMFGISLKKSAVFTPVFSAMKENLFNKYAAMPIRKIEENKHKIDDNMQQIIEVQKEIDAIKSQILGVYHSYKKVPAERTPVANNKSIKSSGRVKRLAPRHPMIEILTDMNNNTFSTV